MPEGPYTSITSVSTGSTLASIYGVLQHSRYQPPCESGVWGCLSGRPINAPSGVRTRHSGCSRAAFSFHCTVMYTGILMSAAFAAASMRPTRSV